MNVLFCASEAAPFRSTFSRPPQPVSMAHSSAKSTIPAKILRFMMVSSCKAFCIPRRRLSRRKYKTNGQSKCFDRSEKISPQSEYSTPQKHCDSRMDILQTPNKARSNDASFRRKPLSLPLTGV